MVVAEIMSKNPFAVQVTESIDKVMAMLREADIRHLPVLEGDTLVGIISDRDVRSYELPALLELDDPKRARNLLKTPVGDIMSSDVVSVNPETDVGELIDLMIEQKIGAVPVVDPDSTELVGIVSYIDALRAARDSL
jgi:acetoin utilization protein AcuB